MEDDSGFQNSQGTPSTSTKFQGMIQTLLRQSQDQPDFTSMQKSDLFHMIS